MTKNLLMKAADNIRRWREAPQIMVREIFGVTPDAWQDEALIAFPTSPRLCMKACKGPGKLQPKSMVVETPTGPRAWGTIQVGDELFAEDGSRTKVTATYDNGFVKTYRVFFNDGTSTLAGAEHLWKVKGHREREGERTSRLSGSPKQRWIVATTEQIIERGVRSKNGRWRQRQFEIPRHGPADFPAAELPLDPYVLGVWIGDGCRRSGRYTGIDAEVENEIRSRGYRIGQKRDGQTATIYGITGALRHLKILDLGSHDRFVPRPFKYASVEQRRDILAGLMDTDGCIGSDGHCEFGSTSLSLIHDVAWLVRSLGGKAKLKPTVKKGSYRAPDGHLVSCRDFYRLTVALPFVPFKVGHKAVRWRDMTGCKSSSRYLTRYIDKIEPSIVADSLCVEIDHPSGCYLANDFIVTHNTAVLAWLGWNFLLTRPHPIIGATSITGGNLSSNLWTELARCREACDILKSMFEMTNTVISARDHPKTWKLEARTWAKDADEQQIGTALSGLHAPYVMWLLDESGDYPDAILPTCEAIFAGSPVEAHIVQAGNPTRLGGPLYRACTTARKLWKVIEITGDPDDPKRSPRISLEHAREQIRQYGRDNPWMMINILGQFPPQSLNALIGPDEVRQAMNRMYREHELRDSAKVIAADVARDGADQSVIAKRQGLQMFPLMKYRNLDGIQGGSILVREWEAFEADACFVDATGGFGWTWIEQARRLGRQPIPVQFSGDAHEKNKFFNKRAEMAFDLVDWIRRGGAIPHDERLLAALTQTTYTHKGDRLILEPKDQIKVKIGFSPDEMDAAMETLAEPVVGASRRRRVNQSAASPDYDPFASAIGDAGGAYDPYR